MANNTLSSNKIIEWGNTDSSKTLVFLHYFGGSADSWQWVAHELKATYRVIAINLPGFGGTTPLDEPSIKHFADDVQHALAQLNVGRYTLIGHSMGGKVAMQTAADVTNDSVEQLILLAPSPPTFEDVPDQEKQQMLVHPSGEAATANIKKNSVQPLTSDGFTLAVETNYMVDENTWRWWINRGMNESIADQVSNLKMPVAIISSEDDKAITPKMIAEEVLPYFKNARHIQTKGVGHLYPLEQPVWVAEVIKQLVS